MVSEGKKLEASLKLSEVQGSLFNVLLNALKTLIDGGIGEDLFAHQSEVKSRLQCRRCLDLILPKLKMSLYQCRSRKFHLDMMEHVKPVTMESALKFVRKIAL